MNDMAVIGLEVAVVGVALALLLLAVWAPSDQRRALGYVAAVAVGMIFLGSFAASSGGSIYAFGGMYVLDEFALFFKRFFLLGAFLVLLMSVEFADRLEPLVTEYYSLVLFALAGMMLAASAHNFCLLFVSLELVAVSFYVLVAFERRRPQSLEAGMKYLILGALSSAFLVYGIAFVFGSAGTLDFAALRGAHASKGLTLGLLLVFAALSFKLAAVPFQMWAPDVYQGSPAPTTAFLAVGSKAAGVVLVLRLLHTGAPEGTVGWTKVLAVLSALTILYGNLCGIPQRNLKRLMGYSSIAHAGYLMLGFAVMNDEGLAAVLYYLAGYLFSVIAAFTVICLALRSADGDDISSLAGLHRRSPLLAGALAIAMASLAGVPPLAGFFGKFLLLKTLLQSAGAMPGLYWLLAVALVGVVVSLYYYFGVIRAVYWMPSPSDVSQIDLSRPIRISLVACIIGMLWLGVFPNAILNLAYHAVRVSGF